MARAHLCGSLNLADSEEVFRTVSEIAGDTISRLPDGETGTRNLWILDRVARYASMPELEPVQAPATGYRAFPSFRLRNGVAIDDVDFGDLGYATAARESYAVFKNLKDEGVLGPDLRFQVSLPTQVALAIFIDERDMVAFGARVEQLLADEVAKIAAAVPHDELAIQWDVAVEFGIMLGYPAPPYTSSPGPLIDQVARHGAFVPDDVELGFHLCYGDAPEDPTDPSPEHGSHFQEPEDTSLLVSFANGLVKRVPHPIRWIHMPVPIDRDDDAYFAPLSDLELPSHTELYLGLVHYQDGLEGTQRRADAAAKVVSDFGVATECGMGRRPRQAVLDMLRIQREVNV